MKKIATTNRSKLKRRGRKEGVLKELNETKSVLKSINKTGFANKTARQMKISSQLERKGFIRDNKRNTSGKRVLTSKGKKALKIL